MARRSALLAAALSLAAKPAHGAPTRLIIDTDMSSDCDDVGATCMAHALMTKGEAEIVAIVHNTGLDTGVGAISTINTWYGRPDIPVGAYKGQFNAGNRGSYVDDLVKRFPSKIKNASQVPDALSVYRKALAGSPDRSVWISSIGFTTNIEALLKSVVVTESSAKTTPPRIGPVRSTGGAQVRSVDISTVRNYCGDIRP